LVLFGDERRDAYESIRVAQLERAPNGTFALREASVPPVLRLGASPFLVRGLRAVLASMSARQRAFAASRRQRTSGAVEVDAADAMRFWGLSTLNGAIPVFAHLVDALDAPPERVYLALAQLVGQLCSFVPDADPTTVPKFNYLDLGVTFAPLFARALELISTTLQERCLEIPLTRSPDGVHVGELAEIEIARFDLFLSVSGTLPEAQIRDRLPRLIKVASANQMGAILHSAVAGAPVELEYRPPSALPMRPGLTWFRVTPALDFWADIVTTRTFAVYHPFDPQALVLGLFAVEKQDRT
jgi:type VI secretion system protein ImpJ